MEIELKKEERIDDLQYKGLKIIQNKNGFCYGLDSVLLTDFAKTIKPNSEVIDLGAGNGILGILLCGKTKLKRITGIEIQEEVCQLAQKNIEYNQLEGRLKIIHEDIKKVNKIYGKETFDAVVTNPPYMKAGSGIENEKETKMIARHEIKCTLEDIIKVSYDVLKEQGELYMVHRANRIVDILYLMRKYKIEPKTIRFVQPSYDKEPNLVLVKGIKNAGEFLKVLKNLIVYKENGSYTQELLEIYNKEEE